MFLVGSRNRALVGSSLAIPRLGAFGRAHYRVQKVLFCPYLEHAITCHRDGSAIVVSKGCPADHGENRAEAARGELVGRVDGTESVADGGCVRPGLQLLKMATVEHPPA